MWRSIVILILLPTLTAAQNAQAQGTSPALEPSQPQLSAQSRPESPKYENFTQHNGIRRGTTEQVAVRLRTQGFVTTPNSLVSGIVPLNLELQPTEGLTITKFRYPKAHPQKFKSQSEPVPVADLEGLIQFKVRVDEKTDLGLHILRGKLTFQPILYNLTPGPVQQLDIEIPLTVVDHNAKVGKGPWPHHMSPGLIVAMIVLSPLVIAVLQFYIICMAAGRCD